MVTQKTSRAALRNPKTLLNPPILVKSSKSFHSRKAHYRDAMMAFESKLIIFIESPEQVYKPAFPSVSYSLVLAHPQITVPEIVFCSQLTL